MNITCGTDIIEIDRIKDLIENAGNDAVNRLYTEKEKEYCESKNKVKYQHYAVRFSAKEAIFKSISNKLDNKFDISWKDVEILNDENGRPEVNFIQKRPKELKNMEISLSHCKEFAVANVIATWED